jgi:hypothetical protein
MPGWRAPRNKKPVASNTMETRKLTRNQNAAQIPAARNLALLLLQREIYILLRGLERRH